ncbi:hypothetical protein TNCV_246331 [Trichonephila clavipes]|nr:hypothetical protein TNCV_246331 [Trichonephila clavipes]
MIPRCIKCGQAHQTKECPIKHVDNTYCINCQTYGHIANYSKCPLYPKPRKGKTVKNNYTTVVESIVRPNLTYAQATSKQTPNNSKNTPQMAPRSIEVPAVSQQTQANRNVKIPIPPQNNNLIENSPQLFFAIVQTLQQTMNTLAILTQQITALDFNTPHPKRNLSNKEKKLYALVEAILHSNDDD